jgi:hypothetical protein
LLAGLIILYLVVGWRELGVSQRRSFTAWQAVCRGLLLAFLPWLHLKLVLPAIILWGFYTWRRLVMLSASEASRSGPFATLRVTAFRMLYCPRRGRPELCALASKAQEA